MSQGSRSGSKLTESRRQQNREAQRRFREKARAHKPVPQGGSAENPPPISSSATAGMVSDGIHLDFSDDIDWSELAELTPSMSSSAFVHSFDDPIIARPAYACQSLDVEHLGEPPVDVPPVDVGENLGHGVSFSGNVATVIPRQLDEQDGDVARARALDCPEVPKHTYDFTCAHLSTPAAQTVGHPTQLQQADSVTCHPIGKNTIQYSTSSTTADHRSLQQADQMAQELRALYVFGTKVGLLPPDELAVAILSVLEERFRNLSRSIVSR